MARVALHLLSLAPIPPALEVVLDDGERGRLGTYVDDRARLRFAVGAVGLRLALGAALGVEPAQVRIDRRCPDCGDPHGRPRVLGSGVGCSVSHAGDVVLVATVSRGEVGVDLEVAADVPPDWDRLLDRVLAPGEPAPPTGEAFLRVWTRKEALLKLSGEGLRRSPGSLALAFDSLRLAEGSLPGVSRPLRAPFVLEGAVVHDLSLAGGLVAALATKDPRPDIAVARVDQATREWRLG